MESDWPSPSSSSTTCKMKMAEQAKEELQMLETHYPNRFDHLKMELKSFLSSLELDHQLMNTANIIPTYSTTASATTQESTSRKRKKLGGSLSLHELEEACSSKKSQKVEAANPGKLKRSSCRGGHRIDLVLQKAHSCLRKLQQLKSTFSLT